MILTLGLMSGCGSSNEEKSVKDGTLTQLNSTPEQAANISGGAINFYDNFNSMQSALTAKKIDKIQTYQSVAEYMTESNPDFKVEDTQRTVAFVDNFCCAMREEDVDLKNSFDAAISSMKSDGTLERLTEQFIRKLALTPTTVSLSKFDGEDTIKVAVTGDLPPLDLVLADGTPAGFNTALLAEISKRIHKNIELVQVDSASRAVALTSGEVDVIFWIVVPDDDSNRAKDFDTPAGVAVTEPYHKEAIVSVTLSALGAGF